MSRGRIRFRLGKPITINARFPFPNFSKKVSREKMDREMGQEDWKRKQTGGRTVGKSVRIDSHEFSVTP